VSAAERLLDSLRDLLFAWTHRFKPRQSASASGSPQVPRIDLHELIERHEARLTPTTTPPRVERVTMHDHAVSMIYDDRREK